MNDDAVHLINRVACIAGKPAPTGIVPGLMGCYPVWVGSRKPSNA